MQNSKLIRLLKSLTSEEFKNFPKFIQSPFFNSNKHFLPFYKFLQKHFPEYDSPKLTKEAAFKKLFSGKAYNYNIMANLMSGFAALTEEYLLNLQFQKTESEKKKQLIKAYGERNLYAFFEKETQRQLKELKEKPYRDVEYYEETARLNFDYFFHTLTEKHTLKDETLMNLTDNLDKQFILAKLRIGSEVKNRERILKKKYELRFLNTVLEEGKSDWNSDLAFELYDQLFQLYDAETDDNLFFRFKKLFSERIQNLRRLDQSLLLTQLINYAARQINAGKTDFYKHCLDLYKLGLKNDLVLENQRINEAVYGNIALLGCHAKEFEWTFQFIENYASGLDEDKRTDAKALSKGLWYFHKNDFEKAYDQFFNHSFSQAYQPKVRINLIKTLFERFLLNDSLYELLIAQIEAFEAFLRRSRLISAYNREAYLNSVLCMKNLATGIIDNRDLSKLRQSILKQIETKDKIMGVNWLITKTNQITQKKRASFEAP